VLAEPLFQATGRLPSDARDRVGHHGRMALAGVGVQLDECSRLPFALPCAQEPCLELLIAEVQVSNRLLIIRSASPCWRPKVNEAAGCAPMPETFTRCASFAFLARSTNRVSRSTRRAWWQHEASTVPLCKRGCW